MAEIETRLKEIKAGKVIDIATGIGQFIPVILEMSDIEEIHALEITERYKPAIEKHFPDQDVQFHVGSAEDLPFENNSFDTITFSNSLHHLPNPQKALEEFARVVKPGGYIIVNEMASDETTPPAKSHVLLHHWSAEIDREFGMLHNPTYESKAIIDLVKSNLPENAFEIEIHEDPWDSGDANDDKMIERIEQSIDMLIKRAEKSPNHENHIKKAEEIRQYVKDNGYSPARTLFIIAKKK